MPVPLPVTHVAIQRIREIRKRRNMAVAELVERMAEAGYKADRTLIAHAERGARREISVDWLMAAAEALSVPPASLLNKPSCGRCHDAPPPGFSCTDCGTITPREQP